MQDNVSTLQSVVDKLNQVDTQDKETSTTVEDALATVKGMIETMQNQPAQATDTAWEAVKSALTANGWTAPADQATPSNGSSDPNATSDPAGNPSTDGVASTPADPNAQNA